MRVPLKPLNIIELWYSRDFRRALNWHDRCSFSSRLYRLVYRSFFTDTDLSRLVRCSVLWAAATPLPHWATVSATLRDAMFPSFHLMRWCLFEMLLLNFSSVKMFWGLWTNFWSTQENELGNFGAFLLLPIQISSNASYSRYRYKKDIRYILHHKLISFRNFRIYTNIYT